MVVQNTRFDLVKNSRLIENTRLVQNAVSDLVANTKLIETTSGVPDSVQMMKLLNI